MKYKVFSVLDNGVSTFGAPMFARHVGEMVRSLETEVNRDDERNMLNRHPEDFVLFELGEFDDQSGAFELHVTPQHVMRALEVKKVTS